MRKGISPLVASVILIAATMSIAGILTYWATGFVRTRLGAVENVSETACLSAQFRLYYGKYDNTTPGTLYLILENQRSADLKLENLYLLYSNNALVPKSMKNETLEGNALKSFNITNVSTGFTTGKIKTTCPDVYVDFTCDETGRCT